MKPYVLFFALLFAISCEKKETPQPPVEVPDALYEHPVFDLSALPSITLEVSTAQWNNLLSYFDRNSQNEEKVPADFVFNKNGEETKLSNIAIRVRGNTSRRRPEGDYGQVHNPQNPVWRNAHFSVDFREYQGSQRLFGLRKLILKWHKDDAAFCREVYCYNLFARFGVWTAPRASYAKVYIKIKEDPQPAYFGVYIMLEQVDEAFLSDRHIENRFESSNGNLWKCLYTNGSNGGEADLRLSGALGKMGVEDINLDESRSLRYSYDLKTNKKSIDAAKSEFNTWLTSLNNLTGAAFQTWISENFDVDLFLKTYAVNVAVGMWDDYWGNANNYYLYFENTTQKGYFIPYDYDNTLGTTWDAFDGATEDVLRWGGSNTRPLINKILAISEYQTKYLDYLKMLIDPDNDFFDVDRSIQRIENWHQLIKNDLRSDCVLSSEAAQSIEDRAASWGDRGYKIFQRGSKNFFELKTTAIKKYN